MSPWIKVLVMVFVGTFTLLALMLGIRGDSRAAAGALVIAALISPILLDVWRPGKYVLRKPIDGSADNLINRLRQFRRDHPGKDGALILVLVGILGVALLGSPLLHIVSAGLASFY